MTYSPHLRHFIVHKTSCSVVEKLVNSQLELQIGHFPAGIVSFPYVRGPEPVSFSGSERARPALPPVQNAQHFHELAPDAVGHEVGGPADDELPRSRAPTGTPHVGKPGKPGGRRQDDELDLTLGGGKVV